MTDNPNTELFNDEIIVEIYTFSIRALKQYMQHAASNKMPDADKPTLRYQVAHK